MCATGFARAGWLPGGMCSLQGKHGRSMTFALAGKPPVAPNECASASCRPRLTSNRGDPNPRASRVEPLALLT